MTVIEFFDRESAIENIASTLVCEPEKVVFIGCNAKKMKRSIENYKTVVDARGINVDFSYISVSRNNLKAIVSAIETVVSENADCRIDISGGDELFLVAVGVILEKYEDKVEIHRFDIDNNTVRDCDAGGCVLKTSPINLGIDENIRFYGGRVIYTEEKANSTYKWNFTDEFISDIKAMWNICRKDVRAWNSRTNTIAKFCNRYLDESTLNLSVKSDVLKAEPYISKEFFLELEKCGVIKNLEIGKGISFDFRNDDIVRCLTKAGQLLELVIAVTAVELNDNGKKVYNDVKTGVYIDWDGVVSDADRADIKNEIDVILMDGMIPVFVSCKNGAVDSDELYKLEVVSERFGGKFVRKVLVTTQLDEMGYKADYIRERAKDMGIRVVENLDAIGEKEIRDTVAKFRIK